MKNARRLFQGVLAGGCRLAALAFALTLGGVSARAHPFAYVTNLLSNSVSVVDTTTNAIAATVSVGSNPNAVAITPSGTFAYVTNNGSNSVSVIDTTTNTVVATVLVGSKPNAVAITRNGAFAYVTNQTSKTVSVINTASNTVVGGVRQRTARGSYHSERSLRLCDGFWHLRRGHRYGHQDRDGKHRVRGFGSPHCGSLLPGWGLCLLGA